MKGQYRDLLICLLLTVFVVGISVGFYSFTAKALSLNLFSPQVNGRTVKLNGVAHDSEGNFRWDWGDGTIERSWFPNNHTYSRDGQYTIRVTAYSGSGHSITRSKTVEIDTGGEDDFQGGQSENSLSLNLFSPQIDGRTVKINGVAEGSTGPFYWEWGDGTTEHSYFPNQHTYSSSGTYKISVTLSGSGGQTVSRYKRL